MPFAYVEPDIFISHQGVDVFHTYKDGGDRHSPLWFTTDPKTADDCYSHGQRGHFDVRYFTRLANPQNEAVWQGWWKPRFRTEDEAIEALIKTEIEAGRLPIEEAA